MKENINGTQVHYKLTGQGKTRVMLLHGWGCDLHLMEPVANALAETHKILLVDFPGHGESGRPPEPWGVPEYAACLKELMIRLDFAPCSVIAHSFGCRITAWLAAQEPALFDKIIFTGAAGIRPRQSAEAQKRSERYQKLKRRCQKLRSIPFLRKTADKLEKKLRLKYGSRDYNALDDEMKKTFVKVISLDLSELYPRIVQPTLLVWGTEDTETPLWMGEKMEQWIPDAGLVRLEGGTHFAYLEQVERFVLIVRTFLQGA